MSPSIFSIMSRGVFDDRSQPDPDTTFAALNDETCRELVGTLTDSPMSVSELANETDVPLSTTYKKIDRLRQAELVNELTQVDPGGHHRGRYMVDLDRLVVELTDEGKFQVQVERRLDTPENQLVKMWESVRDQAQ